MSLWASDLYAFFYAVSPALAHTKRARTPLRFKYSNGLNTELRGVFRDSHFKITKSISFQISNDPAKTRKRERMKEGEMAKKGKILGIENFKYAVLILQEEDKLGENAFWKKQEEIC